MQQQVAAVAPAKQRVKPFGGLTANGELEFGGDGLGSQRHGRETAREQGQQGQCPHQDWRTKQAIDAAMFNLHHDPCSQDSLAEMQRHLNEASEGPMPAPVSN
ncbi:hypothetical protein KAM364_39740 [Aeromonas caviae]|nr:hypothetical protein KAM364_39740 [Aeromonas caviae]